MNAMDQKIALCNQLNMNFEEANELFDNESLASMQMARVNGGGLGAALASIDQIMTIIGALSSVISCVIATTLFSKDMSESSEPTPSACSLEDIIKQMQPIIKEAQKNGKISIETEVDSIIGTNWYGYKLKIEIGTPDK